MKKKTKNMAEAAAIGVAAASIGLSTFYLYGSKHAKKNRKKVATWMQKAEKEIHHELVRAKLGINQKTYKAMVAKVAKKYQGLHKIDSNDVREFVSALQGNWMEMQKAYKKEQSIVRSGMKKLKKVASHVIRRKTRR